MKDKVDIQCNKIFHLEDSMVMYGVYNSYTLEDLIKTVHKLHNTTTWYEKLFSGQIKDWYHWYLTTSSQTFPSSCRVAIFDYPFPVCVVYGICCSQVLF